MLDHRSKFTTSNHKVRTFTEQESFEEGVNVGILQMSQMIRSVMDGEVVEYEPAHQLFNEIQKYFKEHQNNS